MEQMFLDDLVDDLFQEEDGITFMRGIVIAVPACFCVVTLAAGSWCCCKLRGRYRALFMLAAAITAQIAYSFFTTHCWALVPAPCSKSQSLCHNVDIQDHVTAASLREMYKARGLPVLMKGLVKEVVSTGMFAPEQFAQQLDPNAKVHVQCGAAEQGNTTMLNAPLQEFVLSLAAGQGPKYSGCKHPYIAEAPLAHALSPALQAMEDKIMKNVVSTFGDLHLKFWWIGDAGVKSGLHDDPEALNVLHQLHGEKIVWVFPPEQTQFMYPSSKFDNGATLSHVDAWDPDVYEKYPLFNNTAPLKVTLGPGDALFIPSGWMHYATTKTSSISVSGRAYTTCESIAYVRFAVEDLIHNVWPTLLHWNGCTCHAPK